MLNSLRKQASGFVMKALLFIIVLSFAAWGVEDMFRGGASNEVARVGKTPIEVERFRTEFNREVQQTGSQIGRSISVADARALGLDRRVLSELMAEATLDEQAKNFGLGVSDKIVVDAITQDENFRGPSGAFDPARFDQILRANGLNEPAYVAAQRRLTTRREIIEGLAGGIAAPMVLADALNKHQNERRSISYIVLPGVAGAEIAAPEDGVLRTYFEERQGTFQAPERRSLTLLPVTAAALAAKETVTDDELKARYEQDKARFTTPERRTVERITFPTIADAKAAAEKVATGTSFDEIATSRNIAVADLSLGSVTKDSIVDQKLADAAFGLSDGQVSAVEGTFAPALVRVSGITPEIVHAYDEVRDELRQTIATERAADKLLTIHDQIEDARAGGSTLSEVANNLGLETRTVEGVDSSGKLAGGADAGVPGGEQVLAQAFQSDVGVENNPVQGDGGSFVWFDVTKVDPARARTFDEARDDVIARWRADEARKRLDAKVDQALTELRAGTLKLPELATREGLEVLSADKIDRRGGPLLGQAAAAQVFSTPQGGFGAAPTPNDSDRVVFQVTQIDTPTLEANSPAAAQTRERLAETLQNDIASQYVYRLQNDLGATVNNQALANALGGQPEN